MSNTWLNENLVAVSENKEIIAYFEGRWQRPMAAINFKPDAAGIFIRDIKPMKRSLCLNCRLGKGLMV
jgi:hypothetical protein